MPTPIRLLVDGHAFEAELSENETAKAILEALPLEVTMARWGDEYYGDVGVRLDVAAASDARDEMAVGELAFWIPGNALCIFFGPTPASLGSEPRAASVVNPVGRVTSDTAPLRSLGGSVRVRISV